MFKKIRYIVLMALAVLAVACGHRLEDIPTASLSDVPVVLELDIDVSDMPGAPDTKGYADPESDAEMMQTLRIFIVRPDGTIEHNRFLDFGSDPTLLATNQEFEVAGNEYKDIYLIANEANKVLKEAYDFSNPLLAAGGAFSKEQMEGLVLSMEYDEQITEGYGSDGTPSDIIPMSAVHKVWMPQSDFQTQLHIFRAATKFTFIFTNATEYYITVDQVRISRTADKEYFFPKDITTEDYTYTDAEKTVTGYEITGYAVPSDVAYDDFSWDFTGEVLPSWCGTDKLPSPPPAYVLPPLYIFEGKWDGKYPASDNSSCQYQVTFVLNGKSYTGLLTNLPSLPRNTHAVVNVKFTEKALEDYKVDLIVDVRPYIEVPYGNVELEPGFGL